MRERERERERERDRVSSVELEGRQRAVGLFDRLDHLLREVLLHLATPLVSTEFAARCGVWYRHV